MAKPLLTLLFHSEDPLGPVLETAREYAIEKGLSGLHPFGGNDGPALERSLPAVSRLANSLGIPVLLSLSNERLSRALDDPNERKALSDGLSRGRLLPTPAAAFGAELPLLAPFEVADEVRLNIDLWNSALFAPPFTARPKVDQTLVVRDPDPASRCSNPQTFGQGKSGLLAVDLGRLGVSPAPEKALARLTEVLRDRKDCRLASPTASPRGWTDQALREILVAGLRMPMFSESPEACFDVRLHGFPLDLARHLAADSATFRVFAAAAGPILGKPFRLGELDGKLRNGLLLRRLARSGAADGIPHCERVRASYVLTAALVESLAENLVDENHIVDGATLSQAPHIASRLRVDLGLMREEATRCPDGSPPPAKQDEAVLACLDRLFRSPTPGGVTRTALLGQIREAAAAILPLLEKFAESCRQGCPATT
ncbi:MAG: hypothetical protein V2A76_14400 [Planctomycetota bacterium]